MHGGPQAGLWTPLPVDSPEAPNCSFDVFSVQPSNPQRSWRPHSKATSPRTAGSAPPSAPPSTSRPLRQDSPRCITVSLLTCHPSTRPPARRAPWCPQDPRSPRKGSGWLCPSTLADPCSTTGPLLCGRRAWWWGARAPLSEGGRPSEARPRTTPGGAGDKPLVVISSKQEQQWQKTKLAVNTVHACQPLLSFCIFEGKRI